jgi:hypothetical protein
MCCRCVHKGGLHKACEVTVRMQAVCTRLAKFSTHSPADVCACDLYNIGLLGQGLSFYFASLWSLGITETSVVVPLFTCELFGLKAFSEVVVW